MPANPEPISSTFGNKVAVDHDSEEKSRQQRVESDSDDSNDDPRYALERYVTLQRQLFAKDPDLTLIDRHKPHNKAKRGPDIPQQDVETTRLLRRIRRLQADILFDKVEAQERWSEVRLLLLKEAAERRVLQLGVQKTEGRAHGRDRTQTVDTSSQEELPSGTKPTHTVVPDTVVCPAAQDSPTILDDHDSALGLGEFFSSLPVQETNADSGESMMTTIANGEPVTIRNFGKWTGMSPRRIFEEACKARSVYAIRAHFTCSSTDFGWVTSKGLVLRDQICTHVVFKFLEPALCHSALVTKSAVALTLPGGDCKLFDKPKDCEIRHDWDFYS